MKKLVSFLIIVCAIIMVRSPAFADTNCPFMSGLFVWNSGPTATTTNSAFGIPENQSVSNKDYHIGVPSGAVIKLAWAVPVARLSELQFFNAIYVLPSTTQSDEVTFFGQTANTGTRDIAVHVRIYAIYDRPKSCT
jgi:hypothetical protein